MKKIVFIAAIALLQACAWVELTPGGEKARVLSADEVRSCKKLGETTVSIKADIGTLERLPERVQKELNMLARNSAAEFKGGGDTVVPIGTPENGKQTYEVYRCIP